MWRINYDDVFASPWCCDSYYEDRYKVTKKTIELEDHTIAGADGGDAQPELRQHSDGAAERDVPLQLQGPP